MYIDGILAQDYGTPYSISFYSKNYNLKAGETINMSEEEKEAIEKAKSQIEEVHNLNELSVFMTDSTTLKTLLNYIDKLQKENEELKVDYQKQWEENCRLALYIDKVRIENRKILENTAKNYIRKDKIRDAIKTSSYPDIAIQKLIELLEEE